MSLLVVGCSHRSAELSLLERLAVPAEQLPKALASLLAREHVLEAVVLSTCNRVEVYAHVTRFHPGLHEVRAWLAERGDIHPQELDDLEYSYHDDGAAAHLFAVAAGLDSMVVGERQIALQVKQAMEVARAEGAARRVLQRLFRQAVRVGRRVRRETDIGDGASSIVDAGLDAAVAHLDRPGLAGRHVLIVGAGKIGALTASRLADDATGRVLVWNRDGDKAARLAGRVGGDVVATGDLRVALSDADLVVCTTGAPDPILDADLVARAIAHRDDLRPLVLLDLAMPRNVDPACASLSEVAVVDLADVRAVTDGSLTREVMASARAIVDDEAAAFRAWSRASEVEPTVRALRQRAEGVRQAELTRLAARLSSLGTRERAAVEALTAGIVNTLLHAPTVKLKRLADAGGAEHYADAVRELFDLDDGAEDQPGADGSR